MAERLRRPLAGLERSGGLRGRGLCCARCAACPNNAQSARALYASRHGTRPAPRVRHAAAVLFWARERGERAVSVSLLRSRPGLAARPAACCGPGAGYGWSLEAGAGSAARCGQSRKRVGVNFCRCFTGRVPSL